MESTVIASDPRTRNTFKDEVMKIDIPGLVFNVRNRWPKEDQPRGIRGSCELAFKNDTCSAMHDREQNYDNKYSRLMRTVHN